MIGMTSGALIVPLLFIALGTPDYIPSARLAALSRAAPAPLAGREAIADALHNARKGRRRHAFGYLTPNTLGTSVRQFHSWTNDVGLLATTRIDCPADRPCAVTPSALLPYR